MRAQVFTEDPPRLIQKCLDHQDPQSWTCLYRIAISAGEYPVRMLVTRHCRGVETDDVVQEFFLDLFSKKGEPLRGFRGTHIDQFRVYLRTMMVHFTQNFLRKARRMQRLEQSEGDSALVVREAVYATASQYETEIREHLEAFPAIADTVRDYLNGMEGKSKRTEKRYKRVLVQHFSRVNLAPE